MRTAKVTSAERVTRPPVSAADAVFLLENGAQMDQPTFHALYEMTPDGFHAELIGGIVFVMASPVSIRHARPHARLAHWLCLYMAETDGTDVLDNATHVMGPKSEPEPDLALHLQAEYGGQADFSDEDKSVIGAPELVVEVANSSLATDLGRKKADYEAAGVQEYVVLMVKDGEIAWFRRGKNGFEDLPAGADGVFRSVAFPGLWLDARSVFDPTLRHLLAVSKKGLASPEHAAFVAELAARKKAAAKKPRKSK